MSERPDTPLRHFRMDRRAVLTSLATGVGAAAFLSPAAAAAGHAHHAAVSAAAATTTSGASTLQFLDQHAFDTLAVLSEQLVPGSRATQVPEFLDRLLAVESIETQKYAVQALGAFEREARAAHGKPWKALSAEQATALLTKISTQPESDTTRRIFDNLKQAVAESYYSTEAGMKELGYQGAVAFAPPPACG